MRKLLLPTALVAAFPALAGTPVPWRPDLGIAEGRCRADEPGPAFLVTAAGLKDRTGTIKVELYPSNDTDFLRDDTHLLGDGKPFRRSVVAIPATGPVTVCIRAPAPGPWSMIIMHDRDGNRKFSLSQDGIGFANNPRISVLARPKAAQTRVIAGPAITAVTVRMNYRRGLLSFGPIG